jgi:hypothetical protein
MQLAQAIAALRPGATLLVTKLDRLARFTRDLLNTLDAIVPLLLLRPKAQTSRNLPLTLFVYFRTLSDGVRQRRSNGPASHRTSMTDAPGQPIAIGHRWRDSDANNLQPLRIDFFAAVAGRD